MQVRRSKFKRESAQRRALITSLAQSLIFDESVETTLPKAKALVSFTEKLITKAKAGNLHDRRQIISRLGSVPATNKLVDEIAPKLSNRNSGHLRVAKTVTRIGDRAQLAKVTFVDDLTKPAPKSTEKKSPSPKKKPTPSKAIKPETKK